MSRRDHIRFAMAVLAGKVDIPLPAFSSRRRSSSATDARGDEFHVADQVHDGSLYLHALARGLRDPMGPHVLGRLIVLRALYLARADNDMLDLIQRAMDARDTASRRSDETADRAYLNGLIDGSGDLLSEDTFPRMEPMFARYSEGSDMFNLLEKAAEVFGDAVQEVAAWTMAGLAIDIARGLESDYDA